MDDVLGAAFDDVPDKEEEFCILENDPGVGFTVKEQNKGTADVERSKKKRSPTIEFSLFAAARWRAADPEAVAGRDGAGGRGPLCSAHRQDGRAAAAQTPAAGRHEVHAARDDARLGDLRRPRLPQTRPSGRVHAPFRASRRKMSHRLG